MTTENMQKRAEIAKHAIVEEHARYSADGYHNHVTVTMSEQDYDWLQKEAGRAAHLDERLTIVTGILGKEVKKSATLERENNRFNAIISQTMHALEQANRAPDDKEKSDALEHTIYFMIDSIKKLSEVSE